MKIIFHRIKPIPHFASNLYLKTYSMAEFANENVSKAVRTVDCFPNQVSQSQSQSQHERRLD